MKIANTKYYSAAFAYLQYPPESEYTAFSTDGFSYINQSIGIALSLYRASKSNYEITVISNGDVATVVEHSIENAALRIKNIINRAHRIALA